MWRIFFFLRQLKAGQNRINKQLKKIMTQEQDLDVKISELKTAVDEAATRDAAISTKLDEANAKIDQLIAEQPELSDELQSVQNIIDTANSIAQGEEQPPVEPPPGEEAPVA